MKKILILVSMLLLLTAGIADAKVRMCIPVWDFDECEVTPENPEPPSWCGEYLVSQDEGIDLWDLVLWWF